ncbi:MAG: polyketide cyclase/dehydrase [Bacteroidetes bacterium]|nr:polyketide cyclase/dehydrase [Bacteroidota bacterium]
MKINKAAPVVQSANIIIQASPALVWAVLTDIDNWPNWHPKISAAKLESPLTVGSCFTWAINGMKIKSTLQTVSPNVAFGWSGSAIGATAIHNWYLTEQAGSTFISVEESMEGWLVRLFKGKMNRDLAKDMKEWLEAMKAVIEKK